MKVFEVLTKSKASIYLNKKHTRLYASEQTDCEVVKGNLIVGIEFTLDYCGENSIKLKDIDEPDNYLWTLNTNSLLQDLPSLLEVKNQKHFYAIFKVVKRGSSIFVEYLPKESREV